MIEVVRFKYKLPEKTNGNVDKENVSFSSRLFDQFIHWPYLQAFFV